MTERKKITLKVNLSAEKLAQIEAMKNPPKPVARPASKKSPPKGKKLKKDLPPISEMGRTVLWLYKTYPNIFFKERSKPLKCNIEKDILAEFEGKLPITKRRLKKALRHYVYSFPYMNGLLSATARYNLQGEFVEDLTDEHKKFAIEWLREREDEKASKAAADLVESLS